VEWFLKQWRGVYGLLTLAWLNMLPLIVSLQVMPPKQTTESMRPTFFLLIAVVLALLAAYLFIVTLPNQNWDACKKIFDANMSSLGVSFIVIIIAFIVVYVTDKFMQDSELFDVMSVYFIFMGPTSSIISAMAIYAYEARWDFGINISLRSVSTEILKVAAIGSVLFGLQSSADAAFGLRPSELDIQIVENIETKEASAQISGTIAPLAGRPVLKVNGADVPVDSFGKFTVNMTGLLFGENIFTFVATNELGQRVARFVKVTRRAPTAVPAPAVSEGRRLALILANSDYGRRNWSNVVSASRDAEEMKKVLRDLGFEIFQVSQNLDKVAMGRVVAAFRLAVEKEPKPTTILLYYSGHGTMIANRNYLVPIGAKNPLEFEREPLKEQDIMARAEYVPVQDVFDTLRGAGRASLLVLDACRDDVTVKSARSSYTKGADQTTPAFGKHYVASGGGGGVFYATEGGNVALQGQPGELSPFTKIFIRHLRRNLTDILEVMEATIPEAETDTGRRPWFEGDITILRKIRLRQR